MTEFWNDNPRIRGQLEEVARLMNDTIASGAFPLAGEVNALVDSRGKMLRPALIIIGSGFGPKAVPGRIVSLAAAIELLHVATLIHDDVIDDADLRRGQATLHTRLGPKEAVLAGDWLFSRCFMLAADSSEPKSAVILSRVIAAICSSEISQDLDKWNYSASIRAYNRKIAGKTAALFSLALQVGAQEAKAPKVQAERLRRAGYDLGMAFQIIDDILDFESTSGVMRKPVGKDLAEGLCTLPLIFALRKDDAGMRTLLARLRPDSGHGAPLAGNRIAPSSGPVDPAAVQAVIERCAALGAIEDARREAQRFTRRARDEISRLPACAPRTELERLVGKLLERDY